MSTLKKKRASKYDKPIKVDKTFNELIDLTVAGMGSKPQKKKEK